MTGAISGGIGQSARLSALQEDDATYVMQTYARQPLALVRGEGARAWDSDGREYIDLVAGIAVNLLGHAHPAVRAALHRQADLLIHTSNLYYTEPQVELARRLVGSAFPARVFFCNSGAEANECAIKIARKWGRRNRHGAHRIICAQGAFHGRTLATIAATGNPRYLEPFAPVVEGFSHVRYDDPDAVEEAIGADVCAVMLEPIQGESGVLPMSDRSLRAIRRICDQRGVLLILDEVQTGMARTGRMWAHQHAGITPDVMTVAKGLGGGVPIGAVIASPGADVLEPGDHGCTFGGNPLATAVALAVIGEIERLGLAAAAARTGEHLRQRLLGLREFGVEDVRGRGLMLAARLRDGNAQGVARAALVCGVIVNAIGADVLRLVPPLIIDPPTVDVALDRLRQALEMAASGPGA